MDNEECINFLRKLLVFEIHPEFRLIVTILFCNDNCTLLHDLGKDLSISFMTTDSDLGVQ